MRWYRISAVGTLVASATFLNPNKENHTPYALNSGIREAKGEVLAFLDDDVTVDPVLVRNSLRLCVVGNGQAVEGTIRAQTQTFTPTDWLALDGPSSMTGVLYASGLRCILQARTRPDRGRLLDARGRYVFKALESDQRRMGPALHLIGRLYAVEERARQLELLSLPGKNTRFNGHAAQNVETPT